MRICILTCAVLVAAVPVSAQEAALAIELTPGHPIYHERENEAGVAMGLSITQGQDATRLMDLCEELRVAAGLGNENGDELRLETIFVVPYKGMAIEGYYWPKDGTSERSALVPGNGPTRAALDGIVARAGIPPSLLDETDVEYDISCDPDEPFWYIAWSDIRPIGDEVPDAVIERARHRFLAVHQSVVQHNARQ